MRCGFISITLKTLLTSTVHKNDCIWGKRALRISPSPLSSPPLISFSSRLSMHNKHSGSLKRKYNMAQMDYRFPLTHRSPPNCLAVSTHWMKWINLPLSVWAAQIADGSFFSCCTFVKIWITLRYIYLFTIVMTCVSVCLYIYIEMELIHLQRTSVRHTKEIVPKQLLLTAYRDTSIKWTEWITAHSCVGPFSCFSNTVWGFTWRDRYVPSPALVCLFVIQWSSTEVNGTKQVSACLACLCGAYLSGDVYRFHFKDEVLLLVAASLVGFNKLMRRLLHCLPGFSAHLWRLQASLKDAEFSVHHRQSI